MNSATPFALFVRALVLTLFLLFLIWLIALITVYPYRNSMDYPRMAADITKVTKLFASNGMVILAVVFLTRQMDSREKSGPPRCLECDYDLTGNTTGRCPECGFLIGHLRRRTARRRARWVRRLPIVGGAGAALLLSHLFFWLLGL